jgi:hypothetical protein
MLAKSLFECAMNSVDEVPMLCASMQSLLDNVSETDIDEVLLRSSFQKSSKVIELVSDESK